MSERFKYAHPVIEDHESEFIKTLATDAIHEYLTPSELVDVANKLEQANKRLRDALEQIRDDYSRTGEDAQCMHEIAREALEATNG